MRRQQERAVPHISHAQWRKIAKKKRRSRIRRLKAQERDGLIEEEEEKNLKSFSYLIWKREQEALDLFERLEVERIKEDNNKKWLERELKDQQVWKDTQEKIALFKAEKVKQEIKIREEWEKDQNKIKEMEEKNKKEKERKIEEFKRHVDNFIEGIRNDLPPEFRVNTQSNAGNETCPFFSKVGACRFFNHCSRNHIKPAVSKTLLMPNFFTHFGMTNKSFREYDTDMCLEFDEADQYQQFMDFYEDVVTEMRLFGKLTQFKVCRNSSPHLKGNVYVSFSEEREALKAYYALCGRFYGGKQISVQFCNIPLWSKALCGLYSKNRCPKGGTCNFLHVFQNPTSEFYKADNDGDFVTKESSRNRNHDSDYNRDRQHSSSQKWDWYSDSDSDVFGDKQNESRMRHKRKRTSKTKESDRNKQVKITENNYRRECSKSISTRPKKENVSIRSCLYEEESYRRSSRRKNESSRYDEVRSKDSSGRRQKKYEKENRRRFLYDEDNSSQERTNHSKNVEERKENTDKDYIKNKERKQSGRDSSPNQNQEGNLSSSDKKTNSDRHETSLEHRCEVSSRDEVSSEHRCEVSSRDEVSSKHRCEVSSRDEVSSEHRINEQIDEKRKRNNDDTYIGRNRKFRRKRREEDQGVNI